MRKLSETVVEWVVPVQVLIVLSLALSILWGIQGVVHYAVLDSQEVWQGTCRQVGFDDGGTLVGLVVDCGGTRQQLEVTDAAVVRSYLKDPGPLQCTYSAAEVLHCSPRPSN